MIRFDFKHSKSFFIEIVPKNCSSFYPKTLNRENPAQRQPFFLVLVFLFSVNDSCQFPFIGEINRNLIAVAVHASENIDDRFIFSVLFELHAFVLEIFLEIIIIKNKNHQ